MATLSTRPLADVIAEVESRLQAAQWEGSAAFGEVRRLVSDDLIEAFQQLVAVRDRVCIVAATGIDWTSPDPEQFALRDQRVARISLLCSDQVLANPTEAIWGGASNPEHSGSRKSPCRRSAACSCRTRPE